MTVPPNDRQSFPPGDSTLDHLFWLLAGSFVVLAVTWVWISASGGVGLKYVGDEAARMLIAYQYSDPAGLLDFVASQESWLTIHPPGDFIYKSLVNQIASTVVADSATLVNLHKALSALAVAGGLTLIGLGLALNRSRLAGGVFVSLAAVSVPVVYTAHHALAEAPALLLVGTAVFLTLREPWSSPKRTAVAAVPLALAGLFRPEAALIFATMALLPLLSGRWRSGLLFGVVAAGPTLALTLATELFTDTVTYASNRPFAGTEIWSVITDARLVHLLWGLGIAPWLGIAIIVGLAAATFLPLKRAASQRTALTLSVMWVFWGSGFVLLITLGVIPQQDRVFVFPAVFGALVAGLLADAVAQQWKPKATKLFTLALALIAIGSLWLLGLANLTTHYDTWDDAIPQDAAEIATFLATNSNPTDSVLLDWMWWWEWPTGVYASLPGLPGGVCNYLVCSRQAAGDPPQELTAGLTPIEKQRLDQAWRFVVANSPKHIVMLTDDVYADWLVYQRTVTEELTSFVRPLLRPDGTCYHTTGTLGAARYCPVLTNDHYLVLEKVGNE